VLFVDLILFKIKKCSHHPKSKSDDQHLIKNVEKKRKDIEQVSICVVQWCKWEKKLEGIIKMSLAFHIKKTQEKMMMRGQKTHHLIFTQIELTDFPFFFLVQRSCLCVRKCFVSEAPASSSSLLF